MGPTPRALAPRLKYGGSVVGTTCPSWPLGHPQPSGSDVPEVPMGQATAAQEPVK